MSSLFRSLPLGTLLPLDSPPGGLQSPDGLSSRRQRRGAALPVAVEPGCQP